MRNKTFFTAFMLSVSIHGVLVLPIFPVFRNFLIEDGSNHMSISMGSIIVGKEQAEKRDSVVKAQKVSNVSELSGQVPNQYLASDNLLGRSGKNKNNKGKLRNQYFAEIRKRIEVAKKYPKLARERDFEGNSEIEFVILSNGKVQDIRLVNSSDYQILDNEALATIGRASPFPPIPEEFGESRIKITIPLVFELKGGW
ncbi:MAG: energy transducer TonB [Candidatus Margulisiibacteriota bacterium]|nr:energy transducer TonB [Candidatus Margulisiibacteriota bacterium]